MLIKFDFKKIVVKVVCISIVVVVLNNFWADNSIQGIHWGLLENLSGNDWTGEYIQPVVDALLRQGYVTPNQLFTYWNRYFAVLVYLFGLIATLCLGFILWRKESVELWLQVT